jgi:hypothetical protein
MTTGHGRPRWDVPLTPLLHNIMPKKISDIALAKVPSFANSVSLFQSKLQIARHASGTIVDYSHALYKAVA